VCCPSIFTVCGRERDILELASRTLCEQAAKASSLVDEALDAGLDGSHPLRVHAKMLRPKSSR
jgi:hypothetical protein